MGILLLNDTSLTPHIGCLAVSDGHERRLGDGVVEQRHFVGELGEYWTGDEEASVERVTGSPLRQEI